MNIFKANNSEESHFYSSTLCTYLLIDLYYDFMSKFNKINLYMLVNLCVCILII